MRPPLDGKGRMRKARGRKKKGSYAKGMNMNENSFIKHDMSERRPQTK